MNDVSEFKEKLAEMARAGRMFMCDAENIYDPDMVPNDYIVVHRQVDYYENGDVICPNCKCILDGPNMNI